MNLRGAVRWLRHRGNAMYCPCCRRGSRAFLPFGVPGRQRPNVRCPFCGSLERHRLLWLYFEQNPEMIREITSVLHVAPEPQVAPLFAPRTDVVYLSIDLYAHGVGARMDLTCLAAPDESFDGILCNHVLEHIPDDRAAMAELFRVLRPHGWAILQVPVDWEREKTHEDPSITDPAERERVFGQNDHVRVYGRDYLVRLKEAGFRVMVDGFVRDLPVTDTDRMGLDLADDIIICRKK